MKRNLPYLTVAFLMAGGALLLAGCNPMLRGFYPDQTANSVTFQISTKDTAASSSPAPEVFASIYESGSSYPIETLASGLSYSSATSTYTASITFTGLQDDSYFALIWLDLNGDGVWENGEPYYEGPDFTLYGAQALTTAVTVP